MALKAAFIGAGSVGFTRTLLADILCVSAFADTHFAFTDVDKGNLDMVTLLSRTGIQASRLPATIEATTDRRRALSRVQPKKRPPDFF